MVNNVLTDGNQQDPFAKLDNSKQKGRNKGYTAGMAKSRQINLDTGKGSYQVEPQPTVRDKFTIRLNTEVPSAQKSPQGTKLDLTKQAMIDM